MVVKNNKMVLKDALKFTVLNLKEDIKETVSFEIDFFF